MSEYTYRYEDLAPDVTPVQAARVMERNVANSQLMDRWRAENAPVATALAEKVKYRRTVSRLASMVDAEDTP